MTYTPRRPSWDDVWMSAANTVGKRSRCTRAKIGCVLVSADNRVVSVSYVGPPPLHAASNANQQSTCKDWCTRALASKPDDLDPAYRDCVSSHAEQNAVARADFSLLRGGTAYVNSAVCWSCAKLLAASGVKRVVMEVLKSDEHRDPVGVSNFLADCGVDVTMIRRPTR